MKETDKKNKYCAVNEIDWNDNKSCKYNDEGKCDHFAAEGRICTKKNCPIIHPEEK